MMIFRHAVDSSLSFADDLVVCVQDEAEWHQADSEQYEAEGEGDLYEFGQECLDRIALALGGKTMVPLAEQALPQLMTDQRWQQRHAALICLAQIAEGCAKVMLQNKQVTGLVQMCKQVSLCCSVGLPMYTSSQSKAKIESVLLHGMRHYQVGPPAARVKT